MLDVPAWPGHRAGQHVDVRLTGEDGYQAQRSYSIASAPEAPQVMLTVERLAEGEVSSYLAGEVHAGDAFEMRGPIGGYFVWTTALDGPLFLVAGGSGVVPLMAMLRHRAAAGGSAPATLLYSSRSFDDIIYRAELERLAEQGVKVVHSFDARATAGLERIFPAHRPGDAGSVGFAVGERPRIFVCGPTPLVEAAAGTLRDIGHEPGRIKTERFGPTGS